MKSSPEETDAAVEGHHTYQTHMHVTHARFPKRLEARMQDALRQAHVRVLADQGSVTCSRDIIIHLWALCAFATYQAALTRTRVGTEALRRLDALLYHVTNDILTVALASGREGDEDRLDHTEDALTEWAAAHLMSADPVRRTLAEAITALIRGFPPRGHTPSTGGAPRERGRRTTVHRENCTP